MHMATLRDIDKRVLVIEQRNAKVESDKAWETSYFRKFLLSLFTYLAIGFYLQAIDVQYPWLNAIVPAIGFMLSTLTLPFFKGLWLKYFYRR